VTSSGAITRSESARMSLQTQDGHARLSDRTLSRRPYRRRDASGHAAGRVTAWRT
jgi:hypothetical protein